MTRVLTEEFNMNKWMDIHDPHGGAKHEHPTGVVYLERTEVIRTFRMGRKNFARYMNEDSRWMKGVELLLRFYMYRWHKHGYIHIGDTLEFSADKGTQELYVHYVTYVVPREWACILSSKVRREELDRQEEQDSINAAISGLKAKLGGLEATLEGRPDSEGKVKVH